MVCAGTTARRTRPISLTAGRPTPPASATSSLPTPSPARLRDTIYCCAARLVAGTRPPGHAGTDPPSTRPGVATSVCAARGFLGRCFWSAPEYNRLCEHAAQPGARDHPRHSMGGCAAGRRECSVGSGMGNHVGDRQTSSDLRTRFPSWAHTDWCRSGGHVGDADEHAPWGDPRVYQVHAAEHLAGITAKRRMACASQPDARDRPCAGGQYATARAAGCNRGVHPRYCLGGLEAIEGRWQGAPSGHGDHEVPKVRPNWCRHWR
jgi:hypothetical protein